MRQALRLAERGRGRTSPNPLVGALIVDHDGVIVGRGAHEILGGPHAEVHALRDAGERARGATLYCTLEPCAHAGRTGPCAPLVVAAGIRRVVIANRDPNPVAMGGVALLERHGIAVVSGVLAADGRRLNAPFFSLVERGRPVVTMKVAISLDGGIAGGGGAPVALTGSAANRHVHRERAEVDAIAVGSGTILADDPRLTPRGAYRSRPLTRVIFDTRLRTPPSARVFSTLDAGPVIIVTGESAVAGLHAEALRASGAVLLPLSSPGIETALRELAVQGISSLVVEGGASLHRSFWQARMVDRVQVFVADCVIGPGRVPWLEEPVMAVGGVERTARPVGADMLLEGYVHRAH